MYIQRLKRKKISKIKKKIIVFVATHSMWDLSSLTRIKPKPLAVEVQDLNHGSPGKFLSKISLIENIRCLIEVFFFRLLFIFFSFFHFFFIF